MRRLVESGLELAVVALLSRGRSVRIQGGPLHGLVGTVDDASDPGAVVVSVDVLRQGVLLRLPAGSLTPLP